MNKFFAVLLGIILLSSCKYEEKFAFNKRWSGVYTSTLDMTEMEPDKSGELIPFEQARSMEAKINAVEGISNARIIEDREKSEVHFSYSFDGLKAINNLNNADIKNDDGEIPFTGLGQWKMSNKGGKKFFMTMANLKEKRKEISLADVERMGDNFKIKTVLYFRKKVKDLEGQMVKRGENDREIIIEYSPSDMWNPDISWDISVKL